MSEYKIEKIQYEKDWGTTNIGKLTIDYLVVCDGEIIDHFGTLQQAEQFIKENK